MIISDFTARCYAVARWCHGKLSVCLSVRPSVTMKYDYLIITGWKTSKVIYGWFG